MNLGTGAVTLGASLTLTANANTLTVGGVIGGGSSNVLTTAGPGTVILAANNTYPGGTNVNGGTLSVTGTITNTGFISVGNVAGVNAVLNIAGGTVNANNTAGQFTSGLVLANIAGGVGDVQVGPGGNLSTAEQLGLGNSLGGYAGLTNNGGTVTAGSFVVVGFSGDTAVWNQNSGSLNVTSNLITVAAGNSLSTGVLNLNGGSITSTATTGSPYNTTGGIYVGEFGTGTLNVISGTAAFSGRALNVGVNAGANGTVNLNGGSITTTQVSGAPEPRPSTSTAER